MVVLIYTLGSESFGLIGHPSIMMSSLMNRKRKFSAKIECPSGVVDATSTLGKLGVLYVAWDFLLIESESIKVVYADATKLEEAVKYCSECKRLWPLVKIFSRRTLKAGLVIREFGAVYLLKSQRRAKKSCVTIVNLLNIDIHYEIINFGKVHFPQTSTTSGSVGTSVARRSHTREYQDSKANDKFEDLTGYVLKGKDRNLQVFGEFFRLCIFVLDSGEIWGEIFHKCLGTVEHQVVVVDSNMGDSEYYFSTKMLPCRGPAP